MTTLRFRSIRLAPAVLAVALLLTATVATAQEWKGRGRIRGSVKDTAGQPVTTAKVVLKHRGVEGAGPEPIEVDKKGRWAYIGLAGGQFSFTVSAEGYLPLEGNIKVDEYSAAANAPIDVQLRTLEEAGVAKPGEAQRLTELVNQANAKMQSGDFVGARADYQEVLAGVADEAQARQLKMAIAATYIEAGETANARASLEELLTATAEVPAQVMLLQQIARSHYMDNNIDQSVATLDRALALQPGDVPTLRSIIDMLVGAGRENDAEPYMKQLPAGEKVDANALLNLGINAYNDNNLDLATEKFQNVLADYPDNPDAHYYLGLVSLAQGKNDDAKTYLQRFLELAPDHKQAGEAKEFLSYLQ